MREAENALTGISGRDAREGGVVEAVLALLAGFGLPTIGDETVLRWRGGWLRLVTSGDGRRIIVAEAPLGQSFPSYLERLRLRGAIIRRAARGPTSRAGPVGPPGGAGPAAPLVIVFTDGARSRYVWSWSDSWRGGAQRYREYRLPGGEEHLRRALVQGSRRTSPSRRMVGARSHAGLLDGLLPEAMRVSPRALTIRAAVKWIRERESVSEIGVIWKRLREIRIVDLRCGSGSWLISAATVMEGLYLALLDRVVAEVGDEPLRQRAAIATLLDEFIDVNGAPSMESFVRRTVTRRHLFGFDADRRSVRICRRKLWEYVAGAETAVKSAFSPINVRALDTWAVPNRSDRRIVRCRAASGERPGGGSRGDDVRYPSSDPREELRIIVQSWLAAVDAPEVDEVVSDMRKLTLELERRSRRAIAGILEDGSAGSPHDATELTRVLIGTLADETNATIYLREANGCTNITRRGH